MGFNSEPSYSHGSLSKTAVVLANLGTPDAPTPAAVKVYLKEFLWDPRIVEIPRLLWWIILNGIILPFRSRQSAEKYASIWTDQGSPLKVHTERQAEALQVALNSRGHSLRVVYAMRYGNPSLPSVLDQLKGEGCDRIWFCLRIPNIRVRQLHRYLTEFFRTTPKYETNLSFVSLSTITMMMRISKRSLLPCVRIGSSMDDQTN